MMHKRLPLLVLLLALGPNLSAKDGPPGPAPYFDPATIDARTILPTPPADNSDATTHEIEAILQAQALRTPQELARIKAEEHYTVYAFANVVGSFLGANYAAQMPAMTALLVRVAETAKPIVVASKADFNRPRPFLVNSRVFPPIERPKDSGYPSGHSTRATLDSLVLAQLVPDAADAILARGQQIGDDRVIAGVHFPSDVKAGRLLGHAIFSQMMSDPQFQADLKAAQAEVAAELKKPR